MSAKQRVQEILALADVRVGGGRPSDILVHDERLYSRVLAGGSLALGESYMDEWWDSPRLDQFFTKLFDAHLEKSIRPLSLLTSWLKARIMNLQGKSRAFHIAEAHYNLGNDLYRAMLGKTLTYTCGYWKGTRNLDVAQTKKLDLVCKKIGLKRGDRVLDIGCGWGSFALHAAKKYGAKVVGITVSTEQAELAKKLCKGLPVDIRVQDYRDVNETFDHIISLGMFEHVGYKNYRTYMEMVNRCLKKGGLFLLHTIGGNKSVSSTEPWINKYIFPNSMLPSVKQIAESVEGLFVMEDWHNFSADYDKTLMAWYANFTRAWPQLKNHYDERFHRMWEYYLLICAATFRSRQNQLWQIVLSKEGVRGGYSSIR